MSVAQDGKQIVCDTAGCGATAPIPVALRSTLIPSEPSPQTAEGWLYVARQGVWQHFCPKCARQHLGAFSFGQRPLCNPDCEGEKRNADTS